MGIKSFGDMFYFWFEVFFGTALNILGMMYFVVGYVDSSSFLIVLGILHIFLQAVINKLYFSHNN